MNSHATTALCKRALSGALVCICTDITPLPSFSQTNQAAVTAHERSAAELSKHEDLKRLFALTRLEDSLRNMIPKMIAASKEAMPQVREEDWLELQTQASVKELVESCFSVYEKHFSHEEIKEMLRFYDTPLGRKVIATGPQISEELMNAGKAWGARAAARSGKHDLRPRQIDGTQPEAKGDKSLPRKPQLTEAQNRQIVIAHGLDPDVYVLDEALGGIVTRQDFQQATSNTPATFQLPPGVHYMIQVIDPSGQSSDYFSKAEPKPYGGGYKFKMFPGEIEMTVSGTVRIIKIGETN